MQNYLLHEELWRYVEENVGDEQDADVRNKAKCKAKINLSIDRANYTHIRKLHDCTHTQFENCSNTEEYLNKIFFTVKDLVTKRRRFRTNLKNKFKNRKLPLKN